MASITDQIWQSVKGLKVWTKAGQRAPHKPLLLLVALARLTHREDRLIVYQEVKPQLHNLLLQYGPPRKTVHPEYPFWRLQNDGLWEVIGAEDLPKRSGNKEPLFNQATDKQIAAGFPQPIFECLKRNQHLVAEIVDFLLSSNFPETIHSDILDDIGLTVSEMKAVQARDANFRQDVLQAYERQCAICQCYISLKGYSAFLVEAAHIKWHQAGGPSIVNNGLALCTLHHKAFDRGAFTLDNNLRVLISSELHGSGLMYDWFLSFNGKQLKTPHSRTLLPDTRFLTWHRQEVFKHPERDVI